MTTPNSLQSVMLQDPVLLPPLFGGLIPIGRGGNRTPLTAPKELPTASRQARPNRARQKTGLFWYVMKRKKILFTIIYPFNHFEM